jgi:urate oxidase
MRFTSPANFSNGSEFCQYLKDNLRYLVEEGRAGYPKMMSVGLHCRLSRPGRVAGLAEFIDFVKSHKKDVWICTREQIADFWYENHFPLGRGSVVGTEMEEEEKPGDSGAAEKEDEGDYI